ncbi:MAG TPA: hypothetical protein VGF17_01655, partial [Phytomonospora sp.]
MGDFDKYSLNEINEIVHADDPEAMQGQVTGWQEMKKFFDDQLKRFDDRLPAIRQTWSGPAAEVFFGEVASMRKTLEDAAKTADGNAQGWAAIAQRTKDAQGKVTDIETRYQEAMSKANADYEKAVAEDKANQKWYDLRDLFDNPDKPKADDVRAPFDREARTEMDSAATEAHTAYMQKIFYPPDFEPLNDPGAVADPGEWPEYTNTENPGGPGGGRNSLPSVPTPGGPTSVTPPPSTPPPTPP